MDFIQALSLIRANKLLRRSLWDCKEFVFLVNGSTFQVNRPPLNVIFPEGTVIQYRAHIDIRNADGTISTWQPSANDILADDWVEVSREEIL